MKLLQNKSTGEIGCLVCSFGKTPEKITVVEYIDGKRGSKVWYYNSLAELNEEWCDYEEPKEYWYIDWNGEAGRSDIHDERTEQMKLIGNYFSSREEAEQAVLKLKALERLRKNGFRFDGFRQDYTRWSSGQDAFRDGKRYIHFNKADDDDWLKENWEDLKLVFKEEE